MRAMFCATAIFSLLVPCFAETPAPSHFPQNNYRFDGRVLQLKGNPVNRLANSTNVPRLIRRPSEQPSHAGCSHTQREVEVLRFADQGLDNKEIGQHLGMAVSTANMHLQNTCSKLGVSDRTHAGILALQRGIIRLRFVATQQTPSYLPRPLYPATIVWIRRIAPLPSIYRYSLLG